MADSEEDPRRLEEVLAEEARVTQGRAEFLNRVAHDLKSPLTTAMLMADLIGLSDTGDEQRAEYLKLLREQLRREQEILENLLNVTRSEVLKMEPRPAPLDLANILTQVGETVRQSCSEMEISLSVETPADLPLVLGDEQGLRSALEELLENARHFTPAGGEIRVEARVVDDGVAVRIIDNGIGISGEDIPFLFEKYFRGENIPSTVRPGPGLGLSLVRSTVESLGGRVHVESTLGEGTRFEILLLVADDG
ncbi:MAG: HAMP domain-containing histidine kinase [Thermoanaerobaculales bacterium]|nr:HAMP domain-containing histidine kinase [Thermoanaerobaculales bacterium]